MINDEPIHDFSRDRLGFRNIARNLAYAFLENNLNQGFVVGVEGAWGSGKSSLVNMALQELEDTPNGPKVIKFTPWLVGSRNDLLAELFNELEPAILEELPKAEQEDTKRILRRYSKLSSGLAVLAGFAEVAGVPHAGLFSKFFNHGAKAAAKHSEESLSDLNQKLRSRLRKLEHPIVIFVDDLDRLDPPEVAEVLRLIKAVADFPNVAYILAYDINVIAESLEQALSVPNGKVYLEKVVQASFKVPNAMNFDLQNWLSQEVDSLVRGLQLKQSAKERLDATCRNWCHEYLRTPRDVVRVINSLKLNFMPIRELVDPGDMVFLQVIRTKNNDLFNWIERYVSDLVAIADWAPASNGTQQRGGDELVKAIGKEDFKLDSFFSALDEHLPGLNVISLLKNDVVVEVFSIKSVDDLSHFASEKRLASPSHYSLYFSFSTPAGTLEDREVENFLIACEEAPDKAIERFRGWIHTERPQGGRLAEVLLNRLIEFGAEIKPAQLAGLFKVLGEAIDELVPHAKKVHGYTQFLKGDHNEVFSLIERSENPAQKTEILKDLFMHARSLGWLAGILRETVFAHGLHGDREQPEVIWLLSKEDFEMAKDIFVQRLWDTAPEDLLRVPHFLSLMYTWYQVGDADGCLKWIKEQTSSDRGFVDVLEKMTSWSESSSEGVQFTLRQSTLSTFFGGNPEVAKRLDRIAHNDTSDELQHRARQLRRRIDDW